MTFADSGGAVVLFSHVTVTKANNLTRRLNVDGDDGNEDEQIAPVRAVVITRPPEIIACAKIADVFVLFDSHPRPVHPDGAAFIFNKSLEKVATYLTKLLSVDPRILAPGSGLQWQAELLGHASGHFFERGYYDMRMSPEALHAFIEANCALISHKTMESAIGSEVQLLESENNILQRKLLRLQ